MADKPVVEVVAVDAALDALVSPTSSDVYEAVDAFNEKAVAAAAARRALEGGGGGSQPVGCIVVVNSFEIGAASVDYAVWDEIYDNASDTNTLDALPDGIGLSGFGTDTLTTTEAGVWAFTLGYAIDHDATWSGQMHFGNMNGTPHVNFPVLTSGGWLDVRSQVLNLPAGAGYSVGLATADAPTADPFNSGLFSLQIVRLA